MKIKQLFCINVYLNDGLGMEMHSLLRRADARGSSSWIKPCITHGHFQPESESQQAINNQFDAGPSVPCII